MALKIKPLADRVVVEPAEAEEVEGSEQESTENKTIDGEAKENEES